MNTFARFAKDESGATAIEYGLIAMLIGVALIPILRLTLTALSGTFAQINAGLAGGNK